MSIEYKNMLIRFNTDYTSFLKVFKGSYKVDKRTIKGLSKNPSIKLSDSEIIVLLNKIILIKEKEKWLIDNKSLANEILGELYIDNYTNWDMIENNRRNFKIIKSYFGISKMPSD